MGNEAAPMESRENSGEMEKRRLQIEDLPERMRKRFESMRNGTGETKVDGVTSDTSKHHSRRQTSYDRRRCNLTNTLPALRSEVQTGPKPEDKVVYTNRDDGKQTGPGSK